MATSLCTVCNNPMVEGQAFNGMRRAHWDCAEGSPLLTSLFNRRAPESQLALDKVKAGINAPIDRPAPRVPEPGPTSADVRRAGMSEAARQVESRRWIEVSRSPENGKTRIGLECPFCYAIVRAYVWSLPNGKRCECGAYHGRALSTHWSQAKAG